MIAVLRFDSRTLRLDRVGSVEVSTVALRYSDGTVSYETAALRVGRLDVLQTYATEAAALIGHRSHVRTLPAGRVHS